jgi:ATP-dependent DNA helicase RecG
VDAIREALFNSFCHKDYETGQSNEVAIYKDRIEIYNPGAFPEGYEPQDFIDRPERPVRRNPRIARILYYSKDVESFGTGLRRITETCNVAGVRVEFKKLKSGFVVCFYRFNEKADKKADKNR